MLRKVKFVFLFATTVVVNLLLFWSSNSHKCPRQDLLCSYNVIHTNPPAKATINKTKFAPTKPVTVRTKTPVIDMVNDYYPYVDFRFVFPDITPDLQLTIHDIFLVVFVNSAAKGHRVKRDTIRQTWGNHKTCEQAKAMKDKKLSILEWVLVFVIGKTGTEEDLRNIEEAKTHNDMLIGDINDNYFNNIIKLYMGHLWASTLAPKYILKTDDDVYVRIPGVIEYLLNENFPNRFYGGETYRAVKVFRRVRSKWGISRKYYPEKIWPPFNAGAFHVISTDLVGSLFNYIKHRKPFHTDDAYIGVAMKDLKVNVTDIPSFNIKEKMGEFIRSKGDCEILAFVAFAHNIGPKSSKILHGKVEWMCRENFTIKSC